MIKRLLYTNEGNIFISILLGLGIASLFRKICKDNNCIAFEQAKIEDIEGKVFSSNNRCYEYSLLNERCNIGKRIIN